MRIVVYHSSYGCDSGCCGHIIETFDDDGKEIDSKFEFDHPCGESEMEYIKNWVIKDFGEEHCKDIDWENCHTYDD